jgi:hypothetical protein
MRYRQLGRSGLRVSELTLGTMGFGGSGRFADVGDIGVEDARRQLDLCRDAGINLVDTADAWRCRGWSRSPTHPSSYPYWHQAASLGDRVSPADRSLLDKYAS